MPEGYCYIAKERCGCITGAAVDEPQYAKQTAKDVAEWIADGRTIERVSLDIVKASFAQCPRTPTVRWNRRECKTCQERVTR